MTFYKAMLALPLVCFLAACSSLPGNSEFVCNDAATEPDVGSRIDTRGDVLAAVLNEIASLGASPNFKKESVDALSRCDREFLIWYVQMSADSPEKITDHDRKRFERLTKDS